MSSPHVEPKPGCIETNDQFDTSTSTFFTDPATLDEIHDRLVAHIETAVDDAGAEGVVVAMSGGIDSTLTAALALEALGGDRVIGLGLPCNKTETAHATDARTIAEGLGIEYREIQLRPLLESFEETVGDGLETVLASDESSADDTVTPKSRAETNRATGNAVARFRMTAAYYAANRTNRLVLGTANRSELLLGYFTKYGDGGTDLHPLGDLYKTEVRALARHMGLPKRIVGKEPTAGFWAGQTDAGELGAPYEEIDPLLRRAIDRGEPLESAVAELDLDLETARELLERCVETRHKRAVPPTTGIGDRHAEAWPSALDVDPSVDAD